MDNVLELTNIVKTFRDFRAVDEVSFTVERGSFTALLGPNGSGKSTTLKMCSNLIQPTSGSIVIDGFDVQKNPINAMSKVGCVIETPEVYADRTPQQVLNYLGRLAGMRSESAAAETARVLEIVDMSEKSEKKVGTFSKGMRQRIVLAQALINNPSLLLLDEPTSGLDPQGTTNLCKILIDLNKSGITILMSSHMLHEVEGLCDQAVIINHGQAVAQGKIAELTKSKHLSFTVIAPVTAETISRISAMQDVNAVETVENKLIISFEGNDEARADLIKELVSLGVRISNMQIGDTLEETFFSITGEVDEH